METKQTAVKALFNVFKVMSKNMRDAGDEQFANTIDYLCNEYEDKTLAMEKEQIIDACNSNFNYDKDKQLLPTLGEQYYKETYERRTF
jgi:hypothetical protein